MKINRRSFLIASSSALVMGKNRPSLTVDDHAADSPAPPDFDRTIQGRSIAVYTTADKTTYPISATDPRTFKRMGPPLETQICVFVDASEREQTARGGG